MKIILPLLFVILTTKLSAQAINDSDFSAGPIACGAYISECLQFLHTPKSVETDDEPQTGGKVHLDGRDTVIPPNKYSIYQFDSLEIKTRGAGLIDCITFSARTFKTPRGIRVGDSMEKVISKYGKPSEDGQCADETDPEEQVIQYCRDNGAEGIVFFCRKGRVSRISMGLCVHP